MPRKNGWQLAEHAGEARPDGMQRLLKQAVWNTSGVRDELRAYILERLGDPGAVIVIDETSFRKRGKKSAGVGLQYCGTTGQVENCQVGVFLAYASSKGYTLLDRELYLPLHWFEHQNRWREAGIPEATPFQTKPELARVMIERLFNAKIPISWVVGDTVYGGNLDLRTWLEAHGYTYVLAVPSIEAVGLQTPLGRRRCMVSEVLAFHDSQWQRLSMSEGTKGPRLFEWIMMPMLHRWEDDGWHFLLIRRSLNDPEDKTYYFVFAPPGTPLLDMVKAIGQRWHIEECFETSKAIGLEDYEVRSYLGWYRYTLLVMLVEACLAGICANLRSCTAQVPPMSRSLTLLPLTIPEVRRLLAQLLWPLPRSATIVLSWSWWRRCHQSRASFFHTKHRMASSSSHL